MRDKNCLFCKIASKEIASKIIYEDDLCLAFLDINPANVGHTLIIPKEHYPIFFVLPNNVSERMFFIAKKISQVFLKVLKSRGTSFFIANGSAAGQRIPHVIMHVIPRYGKDGINLKLKVMENADKDKINEVYVKIKRELNKLLGFKEEVIVKKDFKIDKNTFEKIAKRFEKM